MHDRRLAAAAHDGPALGLMVLPYYLSLCEYHALTLVHSPHCSNFRYSRWQTPGDYVRMLWSNDAPFAKSVASKALYLCIRHSDSLCSRL